MLAWELVGAVVGAGLASGREIASFFTRHGAWSWAGILLAVGSLVVLSDVQLPPGWRQAWPGKLWRLLLSALLIATGGAMLSGAGEVAALVTPLRYARVIGMLLTLVLAWLLARHTIAGLAWVSRGMLAVLAVMISLGLFLPPKETARLSNGGGVQALLQGLTYGGFNAALQVPILMQAACDDAARRRCIRQAGGVTLLLLTLGNAVLLRHTALLDEPLPFLRMLSGLGKAGYWLCALSLYLAILSTLTACLRGLQGTWLPLCGIIAVSLLGFSGVVARVYPLLGGGCCVMLLMAKFTNCARNPFHSRRDML